MKKFVFIMFSALVLSSCIKHGFDYSYTDSRKSEFEQSFNRQFGTPAEDQDWGFNEDNIQFLYDDTKATTRSANVNGNMWYQKWERPVNITDAERTKVVEAFSKVRENAVNTVNIPWDNYWVQQVHQGTRASVDGNGNKVYPSGVMNRLMAYNFNNDEYEHVNNFNSANNTTEYTDDVTHEKFIGTTLMTDMGSGDKLDQFAYHNTSSSDYYYDYIVLEIDGSYYVGFDIVGYHPIGQDANANMDVERDWIFDDWIVKISPAMYNMDGAVRIIAEDLGDSRGSDFDYNDVVFDAKVTKEWVGSLNANYFVAYITLRAAGGTLPLRVAGEEVHEKFGVDTRIMVNTGGISKPAVSYMAYLRPIGNNEWGLSAVDVVKSIPVTVIYTNGETINLGVETGKAPEKICVTTGFEWTEEREPIYRKYPLFSDWVSDKTVDWQH